MEKYESELTLFLQKFLREHPETIEKQKQARATWWDKPMDLEQRAANDASKVAKRPYEYYSSNR
jgi:hypothetical protein